MTLNAIAKLCACTMAFAATMPLAAAVETVNGIEWNYTVSNGKAMLGGGSSLSRAVSTSTSGSITIPSTLGGCPVTSIGKYAFYDCRMLTSVMIPSSVTSIGGYAFNGCSGIRSVVVPQCVCTMRLSSVFPSAHMFITNVVISGDVTIIGAEAFRGSRLTSMAIPDRVTSIYRGRFRPSPRRRSSRSTNFFRLD